MLAFAVVFRPPRCTSITFALYLRRRLSSLSHPVPNKSTATSCIVHAAATPCALVHNRTRYRCQLPRPPPTLTLPPRASLPLPLTVRPTAVALATSSLDACTSSARPHPAAASFAQSSHPSASQSGSGIPTLSSCRTIVLLQKGRFALLQVASTGHHTKGLLHLRALETRSRIV